MLKYYKVSNNYIVVKDKRQLNISDIINDCALQLCVPTYKGESLGSILQKICTSAGGKFTIYFNNTDSITFNYDGTTVTANVVDSYIRNLLSEGQGIDYDPVTGIITNIGVTSINGETGNITLPETDGFFLFDSFRVGDVGYPTNGETTYTHVDLSEYVEDEDDIMFFADGLLLYPNAMDEFSYSYNPLNPDDIVINSPFITGMRVRIYVRKKTTGPVTTTTTTTTSTTTTSTSTTTTSTTTTTSSSTTTTTTISPYSTIYYGISVDSTVSTSGEVLSGNITSQIGAGTVNIDYTIYPSPEYLWLAIPNLGPSYNKTQWYEGPLNNGNMGTISDLFGPPTTVNISGQDYLVWVTTYQTSFAGIVQFS